MTEPSAIRRRRRKYRPAALRIQLLPRALARLISWHPLNAARAGAAVGAAVQESSIDTAEQLKEASVKGFTDDAHLADLVRQLIASMNE